jgi:hypothetical protein
MTHLIFALEHAVSSNEQLKNEFDQAMHEIYHRALSEAGYKASIFLNMLFTHRGIETARRLIHSPNISDGYTALWERKRLDLTVEALIHDNEKWHTLFTTEELAICHKRLRQYEYIES